MANAKRPDDGAPRMTRALGLLVATALLTGCPGPGVVDAGNPGPSRAELAAPANLQFWNGRWSPDGRKIALHCSTKGASTSDFIAVMDETGTSLTAVADAGTYLATAAWGPGGTSVYFTDSKGISKVGVQGGAATAVATPFAAYELDVSRDGKRLTYTSNGLNEIALVELADGGVATVHTGQAARFSPDGGQLAFVDGVSGKEHFWLYTFAAKSVADLGEANTTLASVGWFPDGKHLAVTSNLGIEVLTVDPTPVARKLLFGDAFAATGIDVAPDAAKLLYRVNGSTGLYVLTGF